MFLVVSANLLGIQLSFWVLVFVPNHESTFQKIVFFEAVQRVVFLLFGVEFSKCVPFALQEHYAIEFEGVLEHFLARRQEKQEHKMTSKRGFEISHPESPAPRPSAFSRRLFFFSSCWRSSPYFCVVLFLFLRLQNVRANFWKTRALHRTLPKTLQFSVTTKKHLLWVFFPFPFLCCSFPFLFHFSFFLVLFFKDHVTL